jgi:hypothetical protein
VRRSGGGVVRVAGAVGGCKSNAKHMKINKRQIRSDSGTFRSGVESISKEQKR